MTRARIASAAITIVVVAGGAAIGVIFGPATGTAATSPPTAVAVVGDIAATVAGVGRVVEARALPTVVVPPASSAAGGPGVSASGGASTAPAGAVFATAGGRVSKVLVTVGQQIRAGDEIAAIDDGGAAELALQQASTDVDTARLELTQKQTADPANGPRANPSELAAAQLAVTVASDKLAVATAGPSSLDVTAARAELKKAQADQEVLLRADPPATPTALAAAQYGVDLANLKPAQVTGPPSAAVVAAAGLELKKAQSDLEVLMRRGGPASPVDVSIARLKVRAAEARLQAARRGRDRLVVHAPLAGTVTSLLTAVGAPVDVSSPIASVIDLQSLVATVDLNEFDAAQARMGQRAVVSVDALGGKEFRGQVIEEALTGVESAGVVSFPVRIGVADFGGVKPGMSVSVRIVVAERKAVLKVPLEAIAHHGSATKVTVIDAAGTESEKSVSLGLADNKEAEVLNGLHAGDRVLLSGAKGG